MSNLAEHYTAVVGIIDQIHQLDSPAAAVADGWTQAAATFASLTQSSANPLATVVTEYMGQASQAAFDVLAGNTEVEALIRDYLASL